MTSCTCRALICQCAVLGVLLCTYNPVAAQRIHEPRESRQEVRGVGEREEGAVPGSLSGRVVDAETGEPVAGATVRVMETGRAAQSRSDGTFRIPRLPAGTVTIAVRRIGYAPVERTVALAAGDTTALEFSLSRSALEVAGVVITGVGRERAARQAYQPTAVLEGAELRRRLSVSIASSLAREAGISERYNGPAAAQPVIRGLSGDRVLVLEDGSRTGDVASTAADHAVTIEPLTAERIEVVRGPAGLLYGSNALGGVINVIRDEVPRTVPDRPTGSLSLQGESVNRGIAGGGSVLSSFGPVALRAELSGRRAADTRTPLGELPSTDLASHNVGAGVGRVTERSFLGVAVRDYGLRYGVPGTFQGQTIPGAHTEGVGIELRRRAVRLDGAFHPGFGPFHALEATGSFVRFGQDELERVEGREIVGTQYGQLTGSGRVVAHHRHEPAAMRLKGAAGIWTHWRDFRAAGSNTGSRPARQVAVAGFGYEELGLDYLRLLVGARYDWIRVSPLDTRPSPLLPDVRTRDFGAVSGSFAALLELVDGLTLGASLARSFRTPSVEELFSDGPHLASYSFEIGNPELRPEFGVGADLFIRAAGSRVNAEITVFRNRVRDFIHYALTGEMDPRLRRYPVYRAAQSDATLWGAEGEAQWELQRGLVLEGQASYVHAFREPRKEPLPAVPPLQGGMRLRFERPAYFAGVEWDASAAQRRTAEFETATDGHSMVGGSTGLRWTGAGRLHTLTLAASNLTDTEWRDHLSRIRTVAPQPGRNLRLLYRVDF